MKVHNYNTCIRFSCYLCHCFALYTSSFLHNLVLTSMHLFSLSAPGGIVNLSADTAAIMATLSWDRLAEIEIKARVFNSYFVTLTIIQLLAEDNNQEVCLNESSAMRSQNFTRPGVENTSLLVVNLGKPSCHMLTYFTSNDFLSSAVPHTQYNYTVVAETSFGRGYNISSLSFSSMQAGKNSISTL